MSDTGQELRLVRGETVARIVSKNREDITRLVRQAYVSFGRGRAFNPQSSFLRLEEVEPGSLNRIIALPALIHDGTEIAGIKWISSFPGNIASGLPRASAVLILNDLKTGFPIAVMEGSLISAARTAASAAIGAEAICPDRSAIKTLGVVGTGLIARTTLEFLHHLAWRFDRIVVHDLDDARMRGFIDSASSFIGCAVEAGGGLERTLGLSELVLFATTAAKPYVHRADHFREGARILNISLRDLGPDVVLSCENIVDDAEHCLRAQTSVHLAEQEVGHRAFVAGNIYNCLDSESKHTWTPSADRRVIFSPFGMGILDLAVGDYVLRQAERDGDATICEDFFAGSVRS